MGGTTISESRTNLPALYLECYCVSGESIVDLQAHGPRPVGSGTTAETNQAARSRALCGLLLCSFLFLPGCVFSDWNLLGKSKVDPGPASFELDPHSPELDAAKQLFGDKQYTKAEPAFAKLANYSKNPVRIAEEARFYEGECQFLQKNYRDAEQTYKKLIKDFRYGKHQASANRRLFDIANHWLDDTRKVMEAYEEKKEGKRWFVLPASYVHLSRDKPFYDTEGHALKVLEEVRLNDIGTQPKQGEVSLGEKSLFYIATIKFFRGDYKDADYYYSQLFENYPNSQLAPKAIKQAIVCKQIVNGGPGYDGRTVEKARELTDMASRAYKELDEKWLNHQLLSIQQQQAAGDFKIAEFYRRTGHPGSAYFYYELVRRRYPNTKYGAEATERMNELRLRLDKQQQSFPSLPEQPGAGNIPPLDGSGAPATNPRPLPPAILHGRGR